MIRLNWMLRYSPVLSPEELLEITEELDEVGYGCLLLTVHSRAADYVPIVSRIMDNRFKMKYMLAIRPYLLSPQYLMMLLGGMNSVAKDRVMINWVHGTLGPKENFNAVIDIPDNMSDPKVRRQHVKSFIKALSHANMFSSTDIPESIISGGSYETLNMAKELGLGLGTGYDIFLNNYKTYADYDFKKIFLQVSLIVRDTDEEAKLVKQEKFEDSVNIICGSFQTVENELLRLHSLGVTDLLVSTAFNSGKDERLHIHKLVKSMKEKGVAQ